MKNHLLDFFGPEAVLDVMQATFFGDGDQYYHIQHEQRFRRGNFERTNANSLIWQQSEGTRVCCGTPSSARHKVTSVAWSLIITTQHSMFSQSRIAVRLQPQGVLHADHPQCTRIIQGNLQHS